MNLFGFVPGYEDAVFESGREPALVMLLAFLATFVLARGYTRIARVRGWGSASVGDVHMHHLVVGIVLAFAAGALEFSAQPQEGVWQLLLAAAFGCGVALVLDEFALVFRLEDVYWEQEGRSSIDAVVIATALGAVLVLHLAPFGGEEDQSRWGFVAYVLVNGGLALITALKGKFLTAVFSVFIPLMGLTGAIRLAKPHSPWARRFYKSGSKKLGRAESRYEKHQQRWRPVKERAWNIIGGAPGRPDRGA